MTNNNEAKASQPIVVNMGKVCKRQVRLLKRGKGKLTNEVDNVVEEIKTRLGDQAQDKIIVPIVIVYRLKKKRSKIGLLGF